ncbi:hypothetical protein [Blastococcus mobilis]|uniref:Uncharacterized protein n=1 Tax=Blastococcus mobilis TaxID=1938746 RepID=A0A238WH40_9ACTN|nr:hypothetical protein [Blastococcus mobilis]SNR45643.1 hypothetical protein SAMN06272737_1083 [Blastococcus mobilis]
MTQRVRLVLGVADHPCSLCGKDVPQLVESRNVRRLRDRLSLHWDPHVRLTEVCRVCGGRTRVEHAGRSASSR